MPMKSLILVFSMMLQLDVWFYDVITMVEIPLTGCADKRGGKTVGKCTSFCLYSNLLCWGKFWQLYTNIALVYWLCLKNTVAFYSFFNGI